MVRRLLVCAGVVLSVCFRATSADAAIITQCASADPGCVQIADFSWDRDSFFLDDTFTLANTSSGPLAGDFTDVQLYLDGSNTSQPFFPDPIAPTGSGDSFSSFANSAHVEFLFHGVLFSADLSSGALVEDEFAGNSIASTTLFAQAVPEPSTVSLIGAALLMALRRHKKRTHR
jgi:hypothetical protein